MLWQSSPSVIVGKHQNVFKEVNVPYVIENNIPVVRRISGGGTVYHDEGNINYSMITESSQKNSLINFRKFTETVIEFLKTFGLEAKFEGKNNITLNGKKISGNSAHIFKNRIIHHGTLLFDTRLDELEKTISPQNHDIDGNSLPSVKATVTNISGYIDISRDEFINKFKTFALNKLNVIETELLTKEDIKNIRQLVEKKYSTPAWIYGYSPDYTFKNKAYGEEIKLHVKKGMITSVKLTGKLKPFEDLITGKIHEPGILNIFNSTVNEEMKTVLKTLLGF